MNKLNFTEQKNGIWLILLTLNEWRQIYLLKKDETTFLTSVFSDWICSSRSSRVVCVHFHQSSCVFMAINPCLLEEDNRHVFPVCMGDAEQKELQVLPYKVSLDSSVELIVFFKWTVMSYTWHQQEHGGAETQVSARQEENHHFWCKRAYLTKTHKDKPQCFMDQSFSSSLRTSSPQLGWRRRVRQAEVSSSSTSSEQLRIRNQWLFFYLSTDGDSLLPEQNLIVTLAKSDVLCSGKPDALTRSSGWRGLHEFKVSSLMEVEERGNGAFLFQSETTTAAAKIWKRKATRWIMIADWQLLFC